MSIVPAVNDNKRTMFIISACLLCGPSGNWNWWSVKHMLLSVIVHVVFFILQFISASGITKIICNGSRCAWFICELINVLYNVSINEYDQYTYLLPYLH